MCTYESTLRNAGAEALAKTLMADDGRGSMSDGPCADVITQWRLMKAHIVTLERRLGEQAYAPPIKNARLVLSEIKRREA